MSQQCSAQFAFLKILVHNYFTLTDVFLLLLVESPYKHLSCDCHAQMKRNTAIKLGPVWYVIYFLHIPLRCT